MAKRKALPLESGEHLLLEAPGGWKRDSRSGWKLGHLFLTDRRVAFLAASRVSLVVPLANVLLVTVEKRPFILCSKNVVVLRYTTASRHGMSARVWLITADLETWRARLYQMTQLEVDEAAVARVAGELTPEAEAILRYVWQNGHANIQELAELVDADCHSDVLVTIKAEINPAASQLLGCPILVFLPHGVDPRSGAPVPFSWWIAGRQQGRKVEVGSADVARADVFDEGTYVDVVAELPGVRAEDVLVTVHDEGELVISAASTARELRQEVRLPPGIDAESMTWKLTNGVLLVTFERFEPTGSPIAAVGRANGLATWHQHTVREGMDGQPEG